MTTTRVDERDTTLSNLLARVKAGETIVIARDGEDVAKLTACSPTDLLEVAFPGTIHATKHMRDIEFPPIHLSQPIDVVAMLIEDRR